MHSKGDAFIEHSSYPYSKSRLLAHKFIVGDVIKIIHEYMHVLLIY